MEPWPVPNALTETDNVWILQSLNHSNGCGADPDVLGGHYNPRGTRHGSPVDGDESRDDQDGFS